MSGVGDHLRNAAKIYDERRAVYGDNHKTAGITSMGLFPNGLTIKTPDDWNRLHLFCWIVSKLSRYAVNWDRGGHEDSLDDLSVYAQMLAEIDREIQGRKK